MANSYISIEKSMVQAVFAKYKYLIVSGFRTILLFLQTKMDDSRRACPNCQPSFFEADERNTERRS
ncbi:MAG: hypothetical protein IKX91_00755, partial [Firmicutes bacterium]|nr:hypothetical protein [Bacillota bacterium]